MGQATVYPHGVTIYNPEKCWNGYTLVPVHQDGALLFDMNGNEVRHWKNVFGMPPKLLPGGHLLCNADKIHPSSHAHDSIHAIQIDYDGNVIWKCNEVDPVVQEGKETFMASKQHHDIQREGNPVGYYVPGMDAKVTEGTTLILSHEEVDAPEISQIPLLDDLIVEVDWEGKVIWKWRPVEHFKDWGFDEDATASIYKNPGSRHGEPGDYLHINSASYLGPNQWYDQGDERFHPDNIIVSCRGANISAIVEKKTGSIVWKVGPDYSSTPALRALRQIVGQHHSHMIPQGLPGAGNILIFDNGGEAGYGACSPLHPDGGRVNNRNSSRVVEFNPITLEVVWQFDAEALGRERMDADLFFSHYISSAQRLPNGNTLVDEGAHGRVMEVTPDYEIVWEWICPHYTVVDGFPNNMIYRAYRYPYSYVPQEPTPVETPIAPVDNATFRLPGSAPMGAKTEIKVTL